MSRGRESRERPLPTLRALLLITALLLLGAGRFAAVWDHLSRLPHPFDSSLEVFFPDLVPTATWLRDQAIDEVAVPSRHLRPQLWHRICEMAYPVRCRPFPELLPEPGQWLVAPVGEHLAAESVVLRRQGRLEVRRLTGPWDPVLYRQQLPRLRRTLRFEPDVPRGGP